MTKRKNIKAFTSLWREIFSTRKVVKTKDIQWWLRAALVTSRRQLQGGFVLPTTVMVILVVVLVVTTLVFRSFNRTTQIIGERQQQVIYNAATPAIDRAKSKLENLFTKDTRLPAGVPSDSTLESLLGTPRPSPQDSNPRDIYTIEGNRDNGAEGRLNFGNTPGNRDAAGWYFQERDAQGNVKRIVAYSINFKKQAVDVGNPENPADDRVLARLQDNAATKALNSVVRNGPVNAINANENPCGGGAIRLTANERDWEPISSATLAKTFQVTAVAIDNPGSPNQTLTTLEFQQDRQADKGNKWGVYFRYDLELFNAPQFNWNGAMRSDGNIFLGPFGDRFRAFLISAPNSCVNTSANDSRISVGEYRDGTGRLTFQGQIAGGRLNLQEFNGGSRIDLFTSLGGRPEEQRPLSSGNDSVVAAVTAPDTLALDPVALFTEDTFRARGPNPTNVPNRDAAWDRSRLKKRIENESVNPPYLDDTFRADNRYGPNPTYDGKPLAQSRSRIPAGRRVGDPITNADPNFQSLTRNFSIDPRNPDDLGLDGYWERRAVRGGLRVVVGQRLELAEPLQSPASPVNPAVPPRREHEFLQRRTQHNNLAAVQATAVYHYQNGTGNEAGLPPVACVATTVHPGTAQTLRRSATFDMMNISGTPTLVTDFLNGRGTNGVEFEPIGAGGPGGQMLVALNNLARVSGDPNGAFPPVQPPAGSPARPSLNLTPHGDFSNLRRALLLGAYNTLSIADRSYIDTAACSLGMLAYQVNNLQTYTYNSGNLSGLNTALSNLTNGNANDGEVSVNGNTVTLQPASATGQPLPAVRTIRLPAPPAGPPGTPPPAAIVPPEAYIEALPAAQQQLARFVATKEQVERDRRGPTGTGYACNNNKFYTGAAHLDKLCATSSKYVALYYTFPLATHTTGGNTYNAVNPGDIDLMPRLPGTGLIPRTNVTGLIGTVPGGGASLPNSNVTNLNNLIQFNPAAGTTQYFQVAFKDAGMFNGREMMSKRVLDIDLNLLRTTPAPGGDFWLPINDNTARDPNAPPPTGVVYAFREDAVREDGIARPAAARMDARPGSLGDPVLTATGISVKPVDYLPDPDRRPNGFRLKNGSRLDRGNNSAGMSFISDNAVYIFGDFNLHSTDGTRTNLLEEFTEALRPDWTNFYTRNRRDDRFARPATDTWRPTEVLGDSVTVLSGNFCDGSIEDGIIYPDQNPTPALGFNIQNLYGCNSAAQFTSYLNQNRPTVQLTNLPAAFAGINNNAWVRENPFDPTSPISISPNGKPFYMTAAGRQPYELRVPGGSEAETYLRFEDDDPRCGVLGGQRKCIGTANRTIVNSIIIQSIIPSRAGQSYGGFHNFPRLIENWDNVDLNMAGSFIQLRFSTQATGHYDQDAWEPSQTPLTSGGRHEQLFYYDPPNRRWGYDVALQYQTAGPVARRFSVPGNARSEVYREIPIDDPYVRRILCATKTDGRRVDNNATCN